jgi:outer membrane protein assembly factor BamB
VIVAAYDMNGELKWKAKAGRFVGVNGYSCSPVLFKDKVVINADHDGTGYLVALNRNSGEISWKADRDNEVSLGSFVTPLIREIGDRTQMVLSGNGCVASLDPNDGSRHWFIDGPTVQFVASPVYDGNLLFLSGGHPKKEFLAIRPDGHGNVTESHIAWRTGKGCPMTPSPIVVSDRVIMVNDDGIASCLDADTGERQWMERLGTKHFASPVSAGGLVYLVGVDGVTRVIRPGPTYELVAENRVGDVGQECYASPAVSDGRIFLRVPGYLFCIFSR